MRNSCIVLIIFLFVIAGLNSGCSIGGETPQKIKNYGVIHIGYLEDDLSNNPAAAKQKYQNTNWVIKGCVASISANGNVLLVSHPRYYTYGVACLIDQSDKKQLDFVIKAFGTISGVIESTGYILKVDKFE